MIKERKKKKVDRKKELKRELLGYVRTAIVSFCIGALFALLLSFHARSEMIKNLYAEKGEKLKIEKQIAKQMIANSDYMSELNSKNYTVCMQVGRLYEAAGEYKNAEYAFYLATLKTPEGVYTAYYKLILVLIAQDKLTDAEEVLESVEDESSLNLIKFKTRANIVLGDKYFSINKFLRAAEFYEKANYYYNRLEKKDDIVSKSIQKRLVNSYLEAAVVILKNGYNSDGVRFLNKALKYEPDNNKIKYRLAIVYADLDPIKSVEYFEELFKKIPQDINQDVYSQALMKAANIEDIQGNGTKAKYYRYKVRSVDLFMEQKVIQKDQLDIFVEDFNVRKSFLTYKIKTKVSFQNNSASDIMKMSADFILRKKDKQKEIVTVVFADKKNPLLSNGGKTEEVALSFGNNILTKKQLPDYYLDVYVYKDKKYKTFLGTYKVISNE